MRLRGSLMGLLFLAAMAGDAAAHADSEVVGIWWSQQKDAKIELFIDAGGSLAGRLIAMPTKSASDVDVKNPEVAQRRRPLLGLVIFSGFRQEAKNRWIDGKAYDPQSGGTFSAQIWLEDAGRMMVRGYLGLPLLGRTEIFRRVAGSEPHRRQAGEPELVHFDAE